MTPLKSFFKFVLNQNVEIKEKATQKYIDYQAKTHTKKKAPVFEQAQMETFFTTASNFGGWILMKLCALIGLCCGLRGKELAYLEKSDVTPFVNEDGKKLVKIDVRKVLKGNKTSKERVYYIEDHTFGGFTVYDAISSYKEQTKNLGGERFFVTWREKTKRYINSPVGENSIRDISKNIAKFLGLPKWDTYTSHSFRRTAATHLSEKATPIELMAHFRWTGVSTAMGYVGATKKHGTAMTRSILGE